MSKTCGKKKTKQPQQQQQQQQQPQQQAWVPEATKACVSSLRKRREHMRGSARTVHTGVKRLS
eukprot:1159107-Pelagomonas_calceolata.AAC.1